MVSRGLLFHFGWEARWTLVKNGIIMGETRNAVNVFVGIKQIAVAWVAKMLMPKQAFGANMEFVKMILLDRVQRIRFMEQSRSGGKYQVWQHSLGVDKEEQKEQ